MNRKNCKPLTGTPGILLLLFVLGTSVANAGPGTLASSPLFLSNAVQPNILLLVDDSGSMQAEVLKSHAAMTAHPSARNGGSLDFTPGDTTHQLELCPGFNVLAYNPERKYSPWIGEDADSQDYQNMAAGAARDNPYLTEVTDLSSHFYFVWNDDGDGVYQDGECPTIDPALLTNEDDCDAVTGCVAVEDLSPAEKTNYANWYSYYRKREYVAKRALSQIIYESGTRMGLATLNGNVDVAPVEDIDDITLPVDVTAAAKKETLLDTLFRINSSGGTGLRTGLQEAGKYYEGSSSLWGSSPILTAVQGGECQQNFTIMMTDGFWNGSNPYPSVGNADSDNSSVFDGGAHADGSADISDTLADVAMYYYERDLAPTLTDKVPRTAVDPPDVPNGKMHQHMKTFAVAFGVDGTLSGNPPDRDTAFTAANGGPWPEPTASTLTTIDDMRHAAWNGRGEFMTSFDTDGLIRSLNSAMGSIVGLTSSAAAVALNSGSLSTRSNLFLSTFNSAKWSGDLQSYYLNPVTGVVSGGVRWSAATQLDNRDITSNPRTMLTYDGGDGIPFQWSSLTSNQQNDLRTNSSGGSDSEATGYARLQFLRGDRNCEAGQPGVCSYTQGSSTYTAKDFRQRASRLGDFIHSAPVYVGSPELNWPDTLTNTTPYSNFKLAQANRQGVVYIGGNDGILHGFSEATGAEILGYVPNAMFSTVPNEGLHYLAQPAYSHRYYVDLTPTVSDAYINTGTGTGWKTVLVGGLRGGGRGLYALDITDPGFTETGSGPVNTVMWEFTSADDADLGYTFSVPSIVPMENGEWAAIFGNGYNDAGSGEAQLFILFLEDGLDGSWSTSDYIKISTGAGNTTTRNGLATPAVIDTDGNGAADRVYAADLLGNMWVFDLSSSSTNSWDIAYKSGSTGVPLFTAPSNQPITTAPAIVLNPEQPTSNSNDPNVLVLFGTGQYLASGDNTTTSQQSFYGVWDSGEKQLTQADLVQQVIGTGTTSGGKAGRTLTNNTVDYGSGDDGWYIDLPVSGERVIVDPVIRGDLVYFNTAIPDSSPCNAGGTGWLMTAKYVNGGRPDKLAFDLSGDGRIDALDAINSEAPAGTGVDGLPASSVNLGNKRYTSTTSTQDSASIEGDEIEDLSGVSTGRLSWEEVMR